MQGWAEQVKCEVEGRLRGRDRDWAHVVSTWDNSNINMACHNMGQLHGTTGTGHSALHCALGDGCGGAAGWQVCARQAQLQLQLRVRVQLHVSGERGVSLEGSGGKRERGVEGRGEGGGRGGGREGGGWGRLGDRTQDNIRWLDCFYLLWLPRLRAPPPSFYFISVSFSSSASRA